MEMLVSVIHESGPNKSHNAWTDRTQILAGKM